MTALPSISGFPSLRLPHPRLPRLRLPRPALSARLRRIELTEAEMAATGLILAVPAALDATILWSMIQGGSVLQLAVVYAISGNLTYRLVIAGLTRLQSDNRRAG
jgi:hypothetical protein